MKLSRTIGVEMEGYVDLHPEEGGMIEDLNKYNCSVGHDESLSNTYWEIDEPYGVEVRTAPMEDISVLRSAISILEDNGWTTNDRAGTHIHVDISDYSEMDKVKLLRFGKGIERVIFMLIEDYRNQNRYCEPIHKDWRKVFWSKSKIAKKMNWEAINKYSLDYFLNTASNISMWNGKYQWLNVLGSNYDTAEFRLFHAVNDAEEVIKQAQLAYNIVEVAKSLSPEQIEFVIKTIYQQETAEHAAEVLFETLGMKPMPIKGQTAYQYLTNKLRKETVDNAILDVV